MSAPEIHKAVVAIDSGSPLVSVAFGSVAGVQAVRSLAIAHSSEALLRTIDEVLSEAGCSIQEVDGLVALRGPGSFTGLRVGLATLLGLHQALGTPATAIPTHDVLHLAAQGRPEPIAAVVDALRGEWFVQYFADGVASGPATITPAAVVAESGAATVVGHGIEALAALLPPSVETVKAGELAPLALSLAGPGLDWSPAHLLDPLYLRPPAIHGRSS